jgi:3-oxoacyl-[acyl-carrier protein] reductase
MTDTLRGRNALVTGATGGLGAALAESLAAAGARVALHYLGAPPSEEQLAELQRLSDHKPVVVEADLRDEDEVRTLFATLRDEHAEPDILVNNAGVLIQSRFTDTTLADWNTTLAVNLTGAFLCAREAVPGMLARGHGCIVNIASQLAFKGAKETAAYSASKGGIVGLTRALAREVGPVVRVNAIAPGPIWTPLNDPYADEQWIAERTSGAVLRRLAMPEEVARTVVFLASDAGELMHGQSLHVNGGGVMA